MELVHKTEMAVAHFPERLPNAKNALANTSELLNMCRSQAFAPATLNVSGIGRMGIRSL
jgi:hypothetical protein